MSRIEADLPAVGELSSIAAENNPNRRAFVDDTGASVTWAEFEERSRTAADAFAEHVRGGDRVAFLSESAVDTTVCWNGALKAGAIVSYVHTQASPETVRYSIDQLQPEVLVVHADEAAFFADRVRDDLDADPEVVVVGEAAAENERRQPGADLGRSYEAFVEGAEPSEPDVLHDEEDVAAIVWTSGTTGRPKGWCHTHRGLLLKGIAADVTRRNTVLTSASTSFMAWYGGVLGALVAGGTVAFLPDWSPERWAEAVEEHGATQAGMVPTMWRAVLDLDLAQYDLSSLEVITFVGEKMDRTTLNRLREEICPEVHNHYASTEHLIARNTVAEMEGDRIESVGKPFDGTRVRIVEIGGDPEDTLPAGEEGEIVVKGADSPVWAWGDDETAETEFRDGWWYSGDVGYKDEDGYLFLSGRKDFMIKSKGVKVYPAPIEERLNAHEGVEEAVVVGLEDEEYGQMVTAVVKPTHGGEAGSSGRVSADDLDEWCLEADAIARFERPREYVFTGEAFPRTPSRKLDRKTVIERLESGALD